MRDRLPTRASHDVSQALCRSEDAALFHLECEILELSLALDAQHCRVARLYQTLARGLHLIEIETFLSPDVDLPSLLSRIG